MRHLIYPIMLLVGASVFSNTLRAEEASRGQSMLFKDGEKAVSFQLKDAAAPDRPCPETELLDATPNQQAIAQLLKDERNKNIRPGLTPPDDKNAKGIKIRFDGIRFLRDPKNPDHVRIRLVGPINELEYKAPVSIETLLKSTKPIPVRFESVTRHMGVTVTITTDAKLKWENGNLSVSDTKGTFNFAVARFSPARLMYSNDNSTVSLPNLTGKRVSEDVLPFRTLLEPEKI